jgi:hypothetical protein
MFVDILPLHRGMATPYLLFVTENSEPSFQLFRGPRYTPKPRIEWVASWTPTVENMLEDLLLLIGVEALSDSALRAELLHRVKTDKLSKLRLYDIAEESRRAIYSLLLETKLKTNLASVVTSKPAIEGHFKTGQRAAART